MKDFLKNTQEKNIHIPQRITDLLNESKSFGIFSSIEDLAEASLGAPENNVFEVKYDIPEKGLYTEAVVHRVSNGISVNYTEPYMRRRDPGTMAIADHLPTDKIRFREKYGYDFSSLRKETFNWLKEIGRAHV